MADNAPDLTAADNPELTMDNKAPPTFCRTCDAAFPSTAEWRQHMKSDQHVNMLRKQLATTEDSTLPVSYAELRKRESSQPEDELQENDDTESDIESNPNSEEQLAPDFVPQNCLFCDKANDTFEDSIAHMTSTHSFTVPYQDRLAVDLETVVAYLHLVIYGYHECICCATRRSTVEGVQQHMMAKGHCRFDMSLDLEEFYDTPESEYHAPSSLVQSDQTSLRLPSGKTASHRTQPVTTAPRPSRQTATASSSRSHSHLIKALESNSEITARNAEDGLIPASQISRLSTGDQRSLRHLSEVELRSVLTATTRRIDSSVRLEARAKRKLERKRNKIMVLTKYYKTENPVYQCG